jgi:hypothetical protein
MIGETGSGGEEKLEIANLKWQARGEIGHGFGGIKSLLNLSVALLPLLFPLFLSFLGLQL